MQSDMRVRSTLILVCVLGYLFFQNFTLIPYRRLWFSFLVLLIHIIPFHLLSFPGLIEDFKSFLKKISEPYHCNSCFLTTGHPMLPGNLSRTSE